jgi:hypothetical protein
MLAACFLIVISVAYFSTQEMEVVSFSETSAKFYRTTWHHITKKIVSSRVLVTTDGVWIGEQVY